MVLVEGPADATPMIADADRRRDPAAGGDPRLPHRRRHPERPVAVRRLLAGAGRAALGRGARGPGAVHRPRRRGRARGPRAATAAASAAATATPTAATGPAPTAARPPGPAIPGERRRSRSTSRSPPASAAQLRRGLGRADRGARPRARRRPRDAARLRRPGPRPRRRSAGPATRSWPRAICRRRRPRSAPSGSRSWSAPPTPPRSPPATSPWPRPPALPPPVPSAVTVIPYSFPRLAEQLGYGAGNRAPRYFQRAHDAGCDLGRASLETLVEIGEHLRLRGFAVSLADTLEAWRLATMLAQIRGKTAPSLDEAREAAIATLGRGDAAAVDAALEPAAIGRAVGRVGGALGPNALVDELWRELRARRLPATDQPEDFSLTLNDEVQVGTSVFLHRLRIADVPYASFLGAGRGARADDGDTGLARARPGPRGVDRAVDARPPTSRWSSRSSSAARSPRSAPGSSAGAWPRPPTTGEAAEVLLDAVIARCPEVVAAGPGRLRRAGRGRRRRAVAGPGRGRAVEPGLVRDLARRRDRRRTRWRRSLATTFERAVLRAPAAAATDGDGVDRSRHALRALHEVAMAQVRVDRDAYLAAARDLADRDAQPPAPGRARARPALPGGRARRRRGRHRPRPPPGARQPAGRRRRAAGRLRRGQRAGRGQEPAGGGRARSASWRSSATRRWSTSSRSCAARSATSARPSGATSSTT